jgi:hypothetical protein
MRYILVVLAVLIGYTGMAQSHEWYSTRRDPVFNTTTCCGGTDCAPIPAHAMKVTPDGLRVTLTAEEARQINPRRYEAFDKLIEFDRIQTSEDGQPHICLQPTQNEYDSRQGYYCIFLTPNG